MMKSERQWMNEQRARIAGGKGYILAGRAILFSDLDEGRVILGVTTHRDGQHRPVAGNRCGECLAIYRRQVLGHNI